MKKLSYWLLITFLTFSISFSNSNNSFAEGTFPNQTAAKASTVTEINTTPTIADEKRYQELRKESEKKNELLSPIKVFSNLLTLIAILLVMAWLYNKYGKEAMKKFVVIKKITQKNIKILSTTPLGQNKYLHIVEVDGEKILIGATANNISFLKELKNTQTEKVVSDE